MKNTKQKKIIIILITLLLIIFTICATLIFNDNKEESKNSIQIGGIYGCIPTHMMRMEKC